MDISLQSVPNSVEVAKSNLLAYIEEKAPHMNASRVEQAVDYAIQAHSSQFRKSGAPYVEHPIAVAKLLVEFKMDAITVMAGLLHDVVEDTEVTEEDIREQFGGDVAFMVSGVTKISAFQTKSRVEQQAATFRKMLLSVAKDFRVIMIKFADRLHNMRTLQYMREDKKKRISQETLEIYAPLAHRFGLAKIRWELEDLSFKYLNPESFKNIVQDVAKKRGERETYIQSVLTPIKESLAREGIEAKVYGRPKHLYSIYRKMETRQCTFEDLYDLFAVRLIVPSVMECYQVLGIVHTLWTPLQARIKDYIASPKSNMYQSLHTTVIGSGGNPVEIQIRTHEMDKVAENGIAAHWAYKEGRPADQRGGVQTEWVQKLVEWHKDLEDSAEFGDFFRINLSTEEIYISTPKGDVFSLPKGSTALDFAFAVHSELGHHCIGAKVDGKMVALDKVLRTGSTVQILRSDTQHPTRNWLRWVVTAKAKTNIRRWLKTEEKEQSILLGKELLQREFRNQQIPEPLQKSLPLFQKQFEVSTWEELYQKIGHGDITLGQLEGFLDKQGQTKKRKGVLGSIPFRRSRLKAEDAVLVSGMDRMLFRFASCCEPVPGDDIIGYVTKGQGVSIHRATCKEGQQLLKHQGDRQVPVQWKGTSLEKRGVTVELQAKDKPGLLNEISSVFKNGGIEVERASIVTVKGQVRNRFKVHVSNTYQLDQILQNLKSLAGVKSVFRADKG
jgi:GTP pyrophosphokinase